MSTISTGVGLISGINTADLIDQLMALEARPRQQVEERVSTLQTQKAAFQAVNASLLSLKLTAGSFLDETVFGAKTATSSNTSVLTATAGTSAPTGTYNFTVDKLVSTHQMVSRGYSDADTTALGVATTFRVESAAAKLTRNVELAELNGHTGISRGKIRITDRSGETATIDLSRAITLDNVLEAINNESAINVTASVDGDRLKLTDNTGAAVSNLIVANVSTNGTAGSLGIAGNSGGTDEITGSVISYISVNTPLSALNDGNGVRTSNGANDLVITDHGGRTVNVNLDDAMTIGDAIDAINDAATAAGSNITAAIGDDNLSLKITDGDPYVATQLSIAASNAKRDLGFAIEDNGHTGELAGDRVIASLGSKLLQNLGGGTGYTTVGDAGPGSITVTNRAGVTNQIDFDTARSIQDALDIINNAGAGISAALNAAGNGLVITDTTASTTSNLIIEDVGGGDMADVLGIDTGPAGIAANSLDSDDLDVRYISTATRLDSLNAGQGVAAGKFRITNSLGVAATVDLTQGNEVTLADVISEINSRGISVTASINTAGDGLVLTDSAGGALAMTVEEVAGTTAADLNILGEATGAGADNYIDGAFERSITIETDNTLQDVVDAINSADIGVSATIINDGSGVNPYRVSFTSELSGRRGAFLIDDGSLGLSASTLVEATDAVVFFGSADPAKAVALTSPTNSLTDAIDGVTVDLLGTSTSPVSVTVSKSSETIVSAVKSFVTRFNEAVTKMNSYDKYDSETEQRGILLGDPTLAAIRSQMYNTVNRKYTDVTGQYSYLSQVGVTITDGAKLTFDESKFRNALATDADAVQQLFTLKTSSANEDESLGEGITIPASGTSVTGFGVGAMLEDMLEGLTDSIDGRLTRTTVTIDDQIDLASDRIDQLNILLAARRDRLEAQYSNMELVLAQLQTQQNALSSLASLAMQSYS